MPRRKGYICGLADDSSMGDIDVVAYPYAVGEVVETAAGTEQKSFEPGQRPTATALSDPEGLGRFPDHMSITVYDGKGGATKTNHRFNATTIGELVGQPQRIAAGAPAIIPVVHGEGYYGTSDFDDIEEYVAELHRRESAISEALDKHVNPHLAVPEGVMQVDAAGNIVIQRDGMVIPVPEGQQHMPEYIQWDARYEAQHAGIQRAEARILQFTSIAPVLVDQERSQGRIPSGAALRRLAIPTVNRVRDLRTSLTEAMKDVIVGQVELVAREGAERLALDRDLISVRWPPELSSGTTDEADAIAVLVEAGILDKATAIQMFSKVTRSEAEDIADESES